MSKPKSCISCSFFNSCDAAMYTKKCFHFPPKKKNEKNKNFSLLQLYGKFCCK